jgi:hypothetical protein
MPGDLVLVVDRNNSLSRPVKANYRRNRRALRNGSAQTTPLPAQPFDDKVAPVWHTPFPGPSVLICLSQSRLLQISDGRYQFPGNPLRARDAIITFVLTRPPSIT